MCKILSIILISMSFTFFNMNGQTVNWVKADSLLKNSVQAIYHDTTDNSIYVGGACYRIGNDTIVGIGRYQNGQWFRMGNGVDWLRSFPWNSSTTPNPVRSIIKYKDTIYITGEFSHTDGKPISGIAKWNGTEWKPMGRGLNDRNNNGGAGYKFKIFNNELYLVGAFDSVAGVAANSLAKYNGITWQAVHNLPVISGTPNGMNLIQDLEFYNNELYLTGVMYNNSTIFSTVKWNGSAWVNPGFSVYGSSTLGMFVFKNELYIIGTWSHYSNTSNIGNCIAKYNGSTWQDVGGGMLFYPFYLARARSYAMNNDYLFVGGYFDVCNYNRKINSVVRYDGTNWCSVDTTFHPTSDISSMAFVNDTLFIGGSLGPQFNNNSLAYCKNINHTDTCNVNFVGINELENLSTIKIYPNPTTSIINIVDENNQLQNATIQIKNNLGQLVYNTSSFTSQINLSSLSAGMYFLSIEDKNSKKTIKIIKE